MGATNSIDLQAYIFTTTNTQITSLTQLKGRSFGFVKEPSVIGHDLPQAMFRVCLGSYE